MDLYQYIEAYHQNTLSQAQRDIMDKALQNDPDLRRAVENYPLVEPVLDLLIEEDIRAGLEQVRKQPSRRLMIRRAAIAAAFLGLASIAVWLWLAPKPAVAERLFAEYYFRPLSEETRGTEISELQRQQFERFMQAHDDLEAGRVQAAESHFRTLAVDKASSRQMQAQWFLVMTALKAGDLALAASRLEVILQDSNHEYHERGLKLREGLSSSD